VVTSAFLLHRSYFFALLSLLGLRGRGLLAAAEEVGEEVHAVHDVVIEHDVAFAEDGWFLDFAALGAVFGASAVAEGFVAALHAFFREELLAGGEGSEAVGVDSVEPGEILGGGGFGDGDGNVGGSVDFAPGEIGVFTVAVAVDGEADVFLAVESNGVGPIGLANLGELPAAFDEVIASEDRAVVFDGELVVAVAVEDAEGHDVEDEFVEDGVEDTNADFMAMGFEPAVEDATEELAVGDGIGGVWREDVFALVIFFPLDGGDELNPGGAEG